MIFPAFASWSGGKDSALAVYKARRNGYEARSLLTMMAEEPEAAGRSRSHGLTESVLRRQSESLGVRHVFASATWESYEAVFKAIITSFHAEGMSDGIFGDIDLQAHLEWVVRVCGEAGVSWREPLWGMERRRVVDELLQAGFKALIISCDKEKMGERFLGREITAALAEELASIGVDPAGENGEYHTFVFDGPLFHQPVAFTRGAIEEHDRYLFLSVE
jgi:diphthine-ammonia ligase